MKTYCTLGLALSILACTDPPPPTPAAESKTTRIAHPDNAPVEAEVILQGLMAFVETKDAGRPVVDSIFVNALKGANRLPEVYSQEAFEFHDPFMPPHEPFVAVEGGEITGPSCFINTSAPRTFVLPWENLLELKAHPLCAQAPCGELVLDLGSGDFTSGGIDLEDLVDADDFDASCGTDFLTLDDSLNLEKTTARVRLNRGKGIEAQVLTCTVTFGFAALEGNREGECEGGGANRRLAEQVAVSGPHPVTLSKGSNETCLFSPEDPAKPMRVWFFNVFSAAYEGMLVPSHHTAFYWYYDLASAACNGRFPRPCDDQKNICAGDPKCPQVGLTGG